MRFGAYQLAIICLAALLCATSPGRGRHGGGGGGGMGALGGGMGSKPLEVRGQNRALSMMQVGRGDKTKIGFVQPRKNYRPQILSTNY